MATRKELSEILRVLLSAYPDKKLPEATYQLYASELVDLPERLLTLAVHEHIQKSPWFPRVADLRRIALREMGSLSADDAQDHMAPALQPRALRAIEIELMADFAHGEDLDEHAWFLLINGYETIGFGESAHRNRQRYAHYKQIIESESENPA